MKRIYYLLLPIISLVLVGCSGVHSDARMVPLERYASKDPLPYKYPVKNASIHEKTFIYDPRKLVWAAYDKQGNLVRQGRGSSGRSFCKDTGEKCLTPVGHFRVFRKKGADCVSGKYPIKEGGGARMPYCMFFAGGNAIHGAYMIPGFNASHGCIRLHPASAKWLYNNFIDIGTRVIIKPYSS